MVLIILQLIFIVKAKNVPTKIKIGSVYLTYAGEHCVKKLNFEVVKNGSADEMF